MTESFEDAMTVFRENLAGMYDNGHMTKWADVDTSVDLDRLQEALDNELEQARDPQRIGGMLKRGSFEYAIEQLREFRWQHATNDKDAIVYINNVARAHGQAVKAEYHRGYEDGRRSMDAEHAAVTLRLKHLPLDEDSHGNLSQIAKAVWHTDFGWTTNACRNLRDELVRLMGGVHELEVVLPSKLDEERHEVVCRLREFQPMIGRKPTDEASKLIRCVTGNADSHVACGNDLERTRDLLIHLLGGECNFSGVENYTRADDGEPNPAETPSGEVNHVIPETWTDEDGTCPNAVQYPSITDELCKYATDHANDPKGYYEFTNTDVGILVLIAKDIDEHAAKLQRVTNLWRGRAEYMREECDWLRDRLEEYDKTHIELPKDVDGERIHIGDMVVYSDPHSSSYNPSAVIAIANNGIIYITTSISGWNGPFFGSMYKKVTSETAESIVSDMRLGVITDAQAIRRINALRGEPQTEQSQTAEDSKAESEVGAE